MQVPGYVGICAHCFGPIEDGELHQFRPGGRNFHKSCAAENTYYIRLEKRIAAKEALNAQSGTDNDFKLSSYT